MHVYFFGPETENSLLNDSYQIIISLLAKAGFRVISRTPASEAVDLRPEMFSEAKKNQESLLEKMDGIVLEVTEGDPEIGYLLAFAMMQKKPALCLFRRGNNIQNVLSYLGTKVPRNLTVQSYNDRNLEKIIINYARRLEASPEESDIPSLKFTLRISPKISNYLSFKTHGQRISKADWLRDKINKMIDQDKDYKAFRSKKSEK